MDFRHLSLLILLSASARGTLGCLKEDNTDYWGNGIEDKKQKSVEECANWCGVTPTCNAWTLRKSDNWCWIKTSNSGKRTHTGLLSGSKKCATGCLKEDNIDYWGNPIEDKKRDSLEDCANWCGEEPTCNAWTWRKSDSHCWIKTSDSGRRSDNKVMSGTKNCATGTIQNANWFYITSELNSQAIDIRGARKHENNDVVMWRKTGAANQLWRWVGNILVSKLNGMALTIRDGNRDKKATVWMMPREGSKEQQWRLDDGRLVSGLNGLVLDVKNGDKKRGNTVWMWEKNESKAQKWKLQLAAAVKTVNYCTGEPGCCTEKYKCKELEGGCDNHDQCRGDLMCGNDNCPWPGWHWDGANCCTEGSYKCGEGNKICRECTSEKPCAKGFGDCDKDSECAGDLECGDGNCPWDQHRDDWWYNNDDCCV